MRLPRPTTRRLMVLVAVAAFTLWSSRVRERWVDYRRKADVYGTASRAMAEQANAQRQKARYERSRGSARHATFDADAERSERLAAYQAALKRKYQRAARRPWLTVPPDPPPPH